MHDGITAVKLCLSVVKFFISLFMFLLYTKLFLLSSVIFIYVCFKILENDSMFLGLSSVSENFL
jgi:hypothetical protein